MVFDLGRVGRSVGYESRSDRWSDPSARAVRSATPVVAVAVAVDVAVDVAVAVAVAEVHRCQLLPVDR